MSLIYAPKCCKKNIDSSILPCTVYIVDESETADFGMHIHKHTQNHTCLCMCFFTHENWKIQQNMVKKKVQI